MDVYEIEADHKANPLIHIQKPKNVIPPKPYAYPFLSLKNLSSPYYTPLGKARSTVFDGRDNIEKYTDSSMDALNLLQESSQMVSYKLTPAIGTLKDAYYHKLCVFSKDFRLILGVVNSKNYEQSYQISKQRPDISKNTLKKYSGKSAIITARPNTNFYQFLMNILYQFEGLEELIITESYDRLIIPEYDYDYPSFRKEFLKILFPKIYDKIIFEPFSFNAEHLSFLITRPCQYYLNKKSGIYMTFKHPEDTNKRSAIHAPIIDLFKRAENIIGHIPLKDRRDILLISREGSGARTIINEHALFDALKPLNAKKIKMEHYSVSEQMHMIARARVIVGCHGAGMANAAFLQENARAIELTSRQYAPRNDNFRRLSIIRNIDYDFIYCDEEGEYQELVSNKGNDLRLSHSAISKTVELCQDALNR